jgi:hypothetical protein
MMRERMKVRKKETDKRGFILKIKSRTLCCRHAMPFTPTDLVLVLGLRFRFRFRFRFKI